MLSLALLSVLTAGPASIKSADKSAGGLEETFAKVDPTVVTVRVSTKTFTENERGAIMAMQIFTGSGVLVHGEGFIVTAAHVVEDAEQIELHWADGFKTSARVITLSRTEDLALLKADATPKNAVVAVVGDSNALKVGQRLFAIGAPYGLEHTLTAGVVSALRTNERPGLMPRHLVQTDVALNQGNSGGPLFNEKGEVVGIASFILSQTGGSVGLNFAVPSATIRSRLFEEALPYIGVSLRFIPRDVAEIFNWPYEGAFLVEMVRDGSPAEKAGLKGGTAASEVAGNKVKLGGDLIISVNGVAATDPSKVGKMLRSLKPGEMIRYDVLRGGQPMKVEVPIPPGFSVPNLPKK
ncbi:MAG: trypsin-like peptidase domain-containing protein [Archangium sp.]|nr:trypsin-like peptidase domain-containing protein [Archangium sp.]